ncbi:MAG TPA: sodium-translocating pyrophosphatase, partial [Pontiella sp.]
GMGADLYESYYGSILATATLGATVGVHKILNGSGTEQDAIKLIVAPMITAGVGTIISSICMLFVKCKENATQKSLLRALLVGTLTSSIGIVFALIVMKLSTISPDWGLVASVIAGLAAGVLTGQSTEYYTSDEYKPTQSIAKQAVTGPANTIIEGLATGMYSTGIPVITIVIATICAFGFSGGFSDISMGLYGIGFAAVGMLSTLGITLATDAYGPIADNAGGNAEMCGLDPKIRERTDALDSLGNTTAATGKGFAIGSAALTAMALLAAYIEEVKIWISKLAGEDEFMGFTKATVEQAGIIDFVEAYELHIMNPLLLCGLLVGSMIAFVFCAMTMKAVGRSAGAMVEEVRRQFHEIPGIIKGTDTPDYASCVAISTKGAQKEMLRPSLLAIISPVVIGLILGIPGVMGLLIGTLASGFALATMLNNAGGAWDNAKKYIEKGAYGGKGSDTHKAGIVGDTVGDPCKDTSGPSLNILIKLMTIVSVVFAPVVVKFSPAIQELLNITTK